MRGLIILVIGGVAFFLLTLGAPAIEAMGTDSAKTKQFASAIAFAEGYWDRQGNILNDNVPARSHNPGDLSPGDTPGYSALYTDGSYVSQLPNDTIGWNFLYRKVDRILNGSSSVNRGKGTGATITDIAMIYAGDWQNWAANVAFYLGVSPDITIKDWLNT